jgi:3',5'-cyclic AMP phosphodiesterase CpdA
LACPRIVRVPGNHDARNVGYLHFEDTFGARDSRLLKGVKTRIPRRTGVLTPFRAG